MSRPNFAAFAPKGRPMVVAHRGVPVTLPENTLASFALALEQGADALETDLRFTADDQIVLHHDVDLGRTTKGEGFVNDKTLAEMQDLQTRGRDKVWTNHRVPPLLELIALTQAQVPLLLELKDPKFLEEKYARILVDLLRSTGMAEKVALMSFHFDHVQSVARYAPECAVGYISALNPIPKRGAKLLGAWWPLLFLNPFYVLWGRAMGAVVAPLDPTPEGRIWYYKLLGVDALLADNPASVLSRL